MRARLSIATSARPTYSIVRKYNSTAVNAAGKEKRRPVFTGRRLRDCRYRPGLERIGHADVTHTQVGFLAAELGLAEVDTEVHTDVLRE